MELLKAILQEKLKHYEEQGVIRQPYTITVERGTEPYSYNVTVSEQIEHIDVTLTIEAPNGN